MQYTSALLLAATATSVSANIAFPVPKRELLQARQTDDFAFPTGTSTSGDDGEDEEACYSSAMALETDMPTIPEDLEDYYITYTYTDSCLVVPSSLASDYSAYSSSLDAWYTSSSDDISSFLDVCTDYDVNLLSDYCTEDAAAAASSGSGSGVASATASATSSSDDSSSATAKGMSATSSSKTTASSTTATAQTTTTATAGAVAREAGIVGAVLAGVLGVAIAL